GRYYPSEHQDWEPPQWLHEILATDPLPDPGLPPDPGWDPSLDLPPDPGRDPNLNLPPDPYPDWYQFTAGHDFPAADTEDPPWAAPLEDPFLDVLPL
ncbi:MAG TPA: endonuclease, partial [Arthrobacter sp.]|nr:endonuclease [Arthrobacter sp.]